MKLHADSTEEEKKIANMTDDELFAERDALVDKELNETEEKWYRMIAIELADRKTIKAFEKPLAENGEDKEMKAAGATLDPNFDTSDKWDVIGEDPEGEDK